MWKKNSFVLGTIKYSFGQVVFFTLLNVHCSVALHGYKIAKDMNLLIRIKQKHITSKRLISPYTSGTKLGFISRPIKSADAFLPKYGIKS